MNVLSLFDGMSCGRIALERACIPVTNYYASEIDKSAIAISKHNWPDIVQLGDVTKIKVIEESFLPQCFISSELGDYHNDGFDLLIGGSPCQGFSSAGKQLNFDDPRSKLFFEFVRLKNECKPKYFLLENVRMPQKEQDIISGFLGVKPIMINSNLFSAQNRKRLYWTNIDFVNTVPINKEYLKDIVGFTSEFPNQEEVLEHLKTKTKRVFNVTISKNGKIRPHQLDDRKSGIGEIGSLPNPNDKCSTITATHAPRTYKSNPFRLYELNRKECEQMQTVPIGYTRIVSDRQAKKILGNGWTVNVIVHIFKGLEKPA